MQPDARLETYWISFLQDPHLPFGIGVTAYTEEDAFSLIQDQRFDQWYADASEVRVTRGVTINDILSDEQIREIQNPMELLEQESLLKVVPCFMRYCIDYPDDDSLVALNTVNALAEYGRSKNPSNSYLNFKFLCDEDQRKAVVAFLIWAKGPPHFEDEGQIDRAVRNWRKTLAD